MSRYAVYICGPYDCPEDPEFEHDNYYGCIPKDFRATTGRSKSHKQHRVHDAESPLGYRYLWDGGCDALVPRAAS